MKSSLIYIKIKRGIKVLSIVEVLLLLALNFFAKFWALGNLFYIYIRLAKRLMQKLYLVWNPKAIVK